MSDILSLAGTTYFPKVGGSKQPWYIVPNADGELDITYTIHSGKGERKGIIDDDGGLWVFDNRFRLGTPRYTTKVFDIHSYHSILQAVRLAYLMTEETNSDVRRQKLQERLMEQAVYKQYR